MWRSRALPAFLLIGAQKSGSTSLHAYLSQHHQLVPASAKEVHFFDGGTDPLVDNFQKGQAWYRLYFPWKWEMRYNQKAYESSPLYLFNPWSPNRIFDLIPDAKLIVLLRNPTERAISHYFHERRKNREPLDIYEAMVQEEARLERAMAEVDYKSYAFIHHSYKSRGIYRPQLERYMDLFPREQLLIMDSDELFTEPHAAVKKVFEFVGVDAQFRIEDLSPKNVASNRRKVEPHVYEYLQEYFKTHNAALYDLLGRNYDW